jgi:predicted DNA-binding transcriptional regulator YafY
MEEFRRRQFIEVVLMWDGELTAKRICSYFNVSRTTAQKAITDYQHCYPDNLEAYNVKLKAHTPTSTFKPHYTKGVLSEYLLFFGDIEHIAVNELEKDTLHLEMLPTPTRNIEPKLIRSIIKACKSHKRLDVGYYSVKSGVSESRIISPHTLVYDGMRWHVRAYCERSQEYRDFVLSRFHEEPEFESTATHTKEMDDDWNLFLDIIIQPDPRLNINQRKAIEMDYKMDNGQSKIVCRAALVKYLLQKLRLDSYHHRPEGQQIILEQECWHMIEPYRLK